MGSKAVLHMSLLPAVSVLIFLFAPALRGIALNLETRECAGYWGGDEFVRYPLPLGWKAFYMSEDGLVHTDVGVCRLPAQDCCQQLGYTFVAENIGEKYKAEANLPQQLVGLGLVSILILVTLIKMTTQDHKPYIRRILGSIIVAGLLCIAFLLIISIISSTYL